LVQVSPLATRILAHIDEDLRDILDIPPNIHPARLLLWRATEIRALWRVDTGAILDCSNGYAALFGRTRSDLLGKSMWDILPAETHATVREHAADDTGYTYTHPTVDGPVSLRVAARIIQREGMTLRYVVMDVASESAEEETG